jgi:hypothetical protein
LEAKCGEKASSFNPRAKGKQASKGGCQTGSIYPLGKGAISNEGTEKDSGKAKKNNSSAKREAESKNDPETNEKE